LTNELESEKPSPHYVVMLDDLLTQCCRELKESLKGKVKLGDLLKMIEMRRKLAPGDSSDRAFWDMINQIKTETQSDERNESDQDRTTEHLAVDKAE
jgi:hypothetical protein